MQQTSFVKVFNTNLLYYSALILGIALTGISSASADSLSGKLAHMSPSLSTSVFSMAHRAMNCAVKRGGEDPARYLAIIDYTLPSSTKRFWAFDLDRQALLWEEHVSHGKNSGMKYAVRFSNIPNSKQSSIGLFRTSNSYNGQNGYSMRLHGLEPGFNDKAFERAIVMHGANYVDSSLVRKQGRMGRSWGCPALRTEVINDVINTLEEDAYLFIYYPDEQWLSQSEYLRGCE